MVLPVTCEHNDQIARFSFMISIFQCKPPMIASLRHASCVEIFYGVRCARSYAVRWRVFSAETMMRIPWDNWGSYETGLVEHPIITKTGINVAIYLLGDWLSQVGENCSAMSCFLRCTV